MTRKLTYPCVGTCSKQIEIELEGDVIRSVEFAGGCHGNTQGIAALVEGMRAEEAVARLKGIDCLLPAGPGAGEHAGRPVAPIAPKETPSRPFIPRGRSINAKRGTEGAALAAVYQSRGEIACRRQTSLRHGAKLPRKPGKRPFAPCDFSVPANWGTDFAVSTSVHVKNERLCISYGIF